MSQQGSRVLGLLGSLYEALQTLNAALCAGDGRSVFALVDKLNMLSADSEGINVDELDPESQNLARLMARRIREMNEINQSICQGNLRILQNWTENLDAIEGGYDASGDRRVLAPAGVNLSA